MEFSWRRAEGGGEGFQTTDFGAESLAFLRFLLVLKSLEKETEINIIRTHQ